MDQFRARWKLIAQSPILVPPPGPSMLTRFCAVSNETVTSSFLKVHSRTRSHNPAAVGISSRGGDPAGSRSR